MIKSYKDLALECGSGASAAQASLCTPPELEAQLIIEEKLGYLNEAKLNEFSSWLDAIGKMTRGLIRKLQDKENDAENQ